MQEKKIIFKKVELWESYTEFTYIKKMENSFEFSLVAGEGIEPPAFGL